jgi:penicillin-binding protein 1A
MPGHQRHAARDSRPRIGGQQIVLLPEDWKWTGQRYGDALVKPGDIIYVHLADAMEGRERRATLEQDSGAKAR